MAKTMRDIMTMMTEVAAQDPTFLDLPLFQQSAFDDPLIFNSLRVYVGEIYEVRDGEGPIDHYTEIEVAKERAEEAEGSVHTIQAVVVEAI